MWNKYTFFGQVVDIFDYLGFIGPVVVAGAGLAFTRINNRNIRRITLWMSTAALLILVGMFIFYYGIVFLPAAFFLLRAAISETRRPPDVARA